jgi:hypothetical protein
MIASIIATGTCRNFGSMPAASNNNSPCCRAVSAGPGPPMGRMRFTFSGSVRQDARNRPRSSSLIGLQDVSVPSPNSRNGLPARTRAIWPESDLKNAVGRTMDQRQARRRQFLLEGQFGALELQHGFCTQIAESSTNCPTPDRSPPPARPPAHHGRWPRHPSARRCARRGRTPRHRTARGPGPLPPLRGLSRRPPRSPPGAAERPAPPPTARRRSPHAPPPPAPAPRPGRRFRWRPRAGRVRGRRKGSWRHRDNSGQARLST